ncbi:cation:dicarboxylate symporter family transporter [Liquorilactobacillus mali]|uniref:cation:dicarboxylate symporter family transporter n=1 Tax=Liquorilactobacillus mali TaxID=1618 RepID=UPI00234FC061|nr:cation:dicarboxylase symporter family transporter [Liquorilactobacillus mali]MDC7952820.1 cation:dicarboxylase symporter family transporter [Liquorilactobacillus mali]
MLNKKKFHISQSWQILIGLALGIIFGILFYQNKMAITTMSNIGTIFIDLIQMIVLPIVVSCLTVGIAGMGNVKKLGRVGVKTLIYFEIITTIAIILGLIIANIFHPGTLVDISSLKSTNISQYVSSAKSVTKDGGIWNLILGIVPTNIFSSLSKGNMMPIIFFCVLFGLGTAAMGEKGQIIIDFLDAISQVMFKVTNWVMKTAPIGVCALIGSTVAQMGLSALKPLSFFILLSYMAFIIFVIFVLGIVARIFGFRIWNIFRVVKEEVMLTFSTSSSETVLPQLMDKMEHFGVSRSIVAFVIPTGYSFNLDGAAIYGSLTALFLAQAYNINLSIAQQVSLVLVLMITSKGTAGVSGAVFVVLLATLSTIGVPTAGLALIAGVDRIIDMGRASVNVFGNSLASVVIAKSEHELDEEKSQDYLDALKQKDVVKNISTIE